MKLHTQLVVDGFLLDFLDNYLHENSRKSPFQKENSCPSIIFLRGYVSFRGSSKLNSTKVVSSCCLSGVSEVDSRVVSSSSFDTPHWVET